MYRLLLFLLLTFSVNVMVAQTIQDLEKQKEKTEKEIAYSNRLLDKTQKDRINSINQLNILTKKLGLQSKLVSQTQSQINLLELDLQQKELLISDLKKDLENLKTEYAKLIRYAKRNNSSLDFLVFLFSSNDFNQAYRRMRFYKQFLDFRQKQAKEIVETQDIIRKEINAIEQVKLSLNSAKLVKTNELNNLKKEEKSYQQNINQLKQQEKKLRKEIDDRKRSMNALDKAIADLIAEEAKKAASVVRDGRYLKLSAGFQGNKGRLPWPSPNGIITGKFGEHNHPVLKGVKVKNDGVDITTDKNSPIKSIFDGEVKKIVAIPGLNMAVLIRHGDYLTVYSNITKVSVKVGETVKALQNIGQAYTDVSTQKGIYNLQIWQENKILNPEDWLLP